MVKNNSNKNNSLKKYCENFKVFFKNNKRTMSILITIVLISVVMAFAFYVRSGPITLNGMDDKIAANTYAQIKSLISQDINQRYQNLDQIYKQELIDKEFQKVLDSGIYELNGQKVVLDDLIKQNQDYVKEAFKDDNGQTYLNAIDPYSFLRRADNLVNLGTIGDEMINGEGYETKQLAPLRKKVDDSRIFFHVWLESKLLNKNQSVPEETSKIYLIPVILVILTVIPIYFLIRLFTNDLFAFFGSLLLVSIGTYVSRTVAGFVDTDGYVVLFPILITTIIIFSFLNKNRYLSFLLGLISGFFQGLFLSAWAPGWFIFVFLIFTFLVYMIYFIVINYFIKKIKEFKATLINLSLLLLTYLISSFVFTYLLIHDNIFSLAFNGVISSNSKLATINSNMWPNVFTSVAELNPASFLQIIQSVGGSIVFLIAMLGLVMLVLDFKLRNEEFKLYNRSILLISLIWFLLIINGNFLVFLTANHAFLFLILLFLPIGISIIFSLLNLNISPKIFLGILLSVWMAGTIYMSLNGVRFILLLGPAFAIAFGIGLYYLARIINNFFINEFKIRDSLKKVVPGYLIIGLLFLVLFQPMASQAISISNGTAPNFDDAWYEAMSNIKNDSDSSAIITSWWDFGHFFAAVADRGVTFDGGSQTTPRAYWVGRLLLENDEDKAHDILRMLVCGGNEAHNTFLSYTPGTSADVVKVNKVIISTLGKDINETWAIISNNKYYKLTEEQSRNIMKYLACDKPVEDYLITSGDMVGKAGVWAHWGSWDFTKKYVYDYRNKLTPEEIAFNIDENVSLIKKYIKELDEIKTRASLENIKENDLVNQWFAPYPSYIPIQGQYLFGCLEDSNLIKCNNGVSINIQTGEVSSQFGENVKFKDLYFPTINNDVSKINVGEGDIDLILIPNNGKYSLLLAQSPLGGSVFTKLFYLNGYGTKYFKKFDEKQSMTGVNIKVWKVLWELPKENPIVNVNSVEYNLTKEEVENMTGIDLNNS